MAIHPTAIVDRKAKIGKNVDVGPYAVIGEHVEVGDRTKILHGAHLTGWVKIGRGNEIHMGAVLGDEPQDRSFKKETRSYLVIGDRNIFREHVTVHRGTQPESKTIIGNDNLFMGTVHIAHNCKIGNDITICNGTALGGYVTVEDRAFISGNCAVHQFVQIGTLAMIGLAAPISTDIPPYMLVSGGGPEVSSFNRVGMIRARFSESLKREIKGAFQYLYRKGLNTSQALEAIEKRYHSSEIKHLVAFIRGSKRGIGRATRLPLTEAEEQGTLEMV